ncbi:MAG: UDP-3-O-acyl-N-acetylglucosamine deacetylase [Gemmataceae bacterium]|nr:UDP-3-O-acyl-N-acetylglucosamine deacetylase [Gemmataceae bacterium]
MPRDPVRRHSTRPQRTIARPAAVAGPGILTGSPVRLRFQPAPADTGAVFVRADLPGKPRLPAHVSRVTGTARRTTLGTAPVQVALVEHVLASLAGLRIDNCLVELDGPEPPGLDGSAAAFVQALQGAGIVGQDAPRPVWGVDEPVTVRSGEACLTLHPPEGPGLLLTYFLDYGPLSPLVEQVATLELSPGAFARQVSRCRTFVLDHEADELRRQGIGAHLSPSDILVFGPRGPVENRLRFADEPARHKLLDMVGDLSLLGADLCGHLVAYRSGHPLNVRLCQELHARMGGAAPMRAAA